MKNSNRFNKPKKREYLFDIIPRWIRYSGLPRELHQKYGSYAWPVFSCLISLDCRFNPDDPDWFAQSYTEIAELTGSHRNTVHNIVNKLEKGEYISVIRGKFKSLKSKFKITNPLPTPKGPNSIKAINGGFLGRKGKEPDLRYWQRVQPLYPLDQKERVQLRTPKGTIYDSKGPQAEGHYKNDYKNELREEKSNSSSNLSSSGKRESKPTTWKEGAVRARDIKKMIKKLADEKGV